MFNSKPQALESIDPAQFLAPTLSDYMAAIAERISNCEVVGDARLMVPALLEELISPRCYLSDTDKLLAAGQIKHLVEDEEDSLLAAREAKHEAKLQELAIREALGLKASGDTRTAQTYTPQASLFNSTTLRDRAGMYGPVFFSDLVKESEAMQAEHRAEPKPGTALALIGLPIRPTAAQYKEAEEIGAARPYARKPTPYSFIAALAANVASGRAFLEDINFAQVIRKGGTLAEWAYNAARYVRQQGGSAILSREMQDGLKDVDQGRRS